MDIQKPFIETTELIQKEMADMKTKAEMLWYLDMVKDYIGSCEKTVKVLLKGIE